MSDEKKIIHIEIRDKIAKLVNPDDFLVCGNNDYEVHFDFDKDWDEYLIKTALFVFGNTTVEAPFKENILEKGVAIEKATKCYIGVFSGDLVTTTKAEIKCLPSIRDIAKTPEPPKEDVYNKIIELLNTIRVEGGGILDVDVLPTENINLSVFYRTQDGIYWYDGEWLEIADTKLIERIEQDILKKIPNPDYEENDPESNAYIKNRPLYSEEKDVNIEFTEQLWNGEVNPDVTAHLVSDITFTIDELTDELSPFYIEMTDLNGDVLETFKVTDADIEEKNGNIIITKKLYNDEIFVFIVNNYENLSFQSFYPPSNGIYFSSSSYSLTKIQSLSKSGVFVKKLDNIYVDLKNHPDFKTVESIAKGANQAVSFGNYSTMITALNALPKDKYNLGQNIMIVTVDVPDLWVSAIGEESTEYVYTSDEDFVSAMKANGSVKVGHYQLSQLETQKVDLTDYVKKTDYAANGQAGVVALSTESVCGLKMQTSGGKTFLSVATPDTRLIKQRHSNYVLVASGIDQYVKVAITGLVSKSGVETYGNQPTLTEEEQASARKWLGLPYKDESLVVKYTADKSKLYQVGGGSEYAYLATSDVIPIEEIGNYSISVHSYDVPSGSDIIDMGTVTYLLSGANYDKKSFGYIISTSYSVKVYIVDDYNVFNDELSSTLTSNGVYLGVYESYYGDGATYTEVVSIEHLPIETMDGEYLNIQRAGTFKSGLVRTTSIVTDKTGYTASPIIDGVPYFKTIDNKSLGQCYASCSTAEEDTNKIVNMRGYEHAGGGIVAIKFSNAVSANSTLNINSTGAKSIYFRGAKITDNVIKAGDTATFISRNDYPYDYYLLSVDRWHQDIVDLTARIESLEAK